MAKAQPTQLSLKVLTWDIHLGLLPRSHHSPGFCINRPGLEHLNKARIQVNVGHVAKAGGFGRFFRSKSSDEDFMKETFPNGNGEAKLKQTNQPKVGSRFSETRKQCMLISNAQEESKGGNKGVLKLGGD